MVIKLKDKIKEFKKNDNIKIILDFNSLTWWFTFTIKITDFFIDSGEIVSTKSKRKYESRKLKL